ncbi:hypothetical protein C7H19_16625 [Aphanothece hegewaldii CCALA 016]|uniref:PKD domain-containing protein n=1 Tax=Aphanothece hegewaldii CCALA 016 TaxID=2107694 RepID=A0A2T1LUU9_9CHRO|nr:calcium-binding protein [Aphanothece hegewaldii]PSF35404.1 hypothetical protein C7H19_16625 [Aphanothece hegewaldii CCALA 016]
MPLSKYVLGNQLTVESNFALNSILLLALEQARSLVQSELQEFSSDATFDDKMLLSFGAENETEELKAKWLVGDLSGFPPIEVVNSRVLNGANGAYSKAQNRIYLSSDFLIQNIGNIEAIVAVLLEEYGHSVDGVLNSTDTLGDEGQLFSALVTGRNLSQNEIEAIQAEDDSVVITVDGISIEVEQSQSIYNNGTIVNNSALNIRQTYGSNFYNGYGSANTGYLYNGKDGGTGYLYNGKDGMSKLYNGNGGRGYLYNGNGGTGYLYNGNGGTGYLYNGNGGTGYLINGNGGRGYLYNGSNGDTGYLYNGYGNGSTGYLYNGGGGTGFLYNGSNGGTGFLYNGIVGTGFLYNGYGNGGTGFLYNGSNGDTGYLINGNGGTGFLYNGYGNGGRGFLINEGIIHNLSGSIIINASNSYIFNNGTIFNQGTFTNEGTLAGTGIFEGNLTVGSGIIAPGGTHSIYNTDGGLMLSISDTDGVFTITGDFTQTNGLIKLSVSSPSSFDTLKITGNTIISGGNIQLLIQPDSFHTLNVGTTNLVLIDGDSDNDGNGSLTIDSTVFNNLANAVNTYDGSQLDFNLIQSNNDLILQITQNGLPVLVAVPSGPYNINEGDSLSLDGTGSSNPNGTPLTYRWDLDGDGDFDENVTGATPVLTWPQLNTLGINDNVLNKTITLEVSDGSSSVSGQTTLTVNNTAPIVNAGNDISVNSGEIFNLSGTATDPGNDLLSYAWDLDDDGQYDDATGQNITYFFNNSGTYIIELQVTDDDGGIGTDSLIVTVANVNNAPTLQQPIADQTGGEGQLFNFTVDETTFSDLDGDILTYSLSSNTVLPNGISFNEETRTFNGTPDATAAGIYEITVLASDPDGASASDTFTLAIANLIGTTGNDTLTGTSNSEKLQGLGGKDNLSGLEGNDTLNGGVGNDTMSGGLGDDLYIVNSTSDHTLENSNEGIDAVRSSVNWTLGNDLENLILTGSSNLLGTGNPLNNSITGNDGDNILSGEEGNDNLLAGAGNDTLTGGAGNDILTGGTGNDTLTGGDGADRFRFNAKDEGVDTITDFTSSLGDRIQISATGFAGGLVAGTLSSTRFISGVGVSAATNANQRFIYDTSNGALFFDADGNGGGFAATQIATLTGATALSNTHIVVI